MVLVGRYVDHGASVAVVGIVQDHHILVPRVGPRQSQSQVVRLRAAVDEEDGVEVGREEPQELLGIPGPARVMVSCIGVDSLELCVRCLDKDWVRVSDMGHIVHAVKVPFPRLIKDVLALPSQEAEGSIVLVSTFITGIAVTVLVEQRQPTEHVLGSDASHFHLGHTFLPRVVGLLRGGWSG